MQAPQPQGQQQAGSPSGGVQEVILQTDQNLAKLASALSSAQGVPPGLGEAMEKVREGFSAVVEQLLSGGSGAAPAQGSASMEQGASDAVPFSHAGAQ